jgi:ribonucleotide monophosphatase NagD (HAD superfamily)
VEPSAPPSSARRRWRHVFDTGTTGADHFRTAVRAAFRLIDTDGDGLATHEEVLAALKKFSLVQELLFLSPKEPEPGLSEIMEMIGAEPAKGTAGQIDEARWLEFFCPKAGDQTMPLPQLYDPHSTGIKGFLIDLDGTIYRPGHLIPGSRTFYSWLLASGTPHVFVSNTGSKGPQGTQKKLSQAPYALHSEHLVPLDRIMTAADAQADYMCRTIPPESRVLLISGGGSFWRTLLDRRDPGRVSSWCIETSLTDEQAMEWAIEAERARRVSPDAPASHDQPSGAGDRPRVVVVFFLDGEVSSGWNYTLIKHVSFLLGHGAQLLYTADDPYNPQSDERHGDTVFPLPGPGMFASMLRPVLPLGAQDQFLCCGKGGNVGSTYIMDRAIAMLVSQGHSGDRDEIMMVGDRYGTDIRGATHAGIKSCLVESGCEKAADQVHYPTDRATFYAPSVDHIHPLGPGPDRDVSASALAEEMRHAQMSASVRNLGI